MEAERVESLEYFPGRDRVNFQRYGSLWIRHVVIERNRALPIRRIGIRNKNRGVRGLAG